MALSQTQIVDYLFKKVGFSISKTDVSTAKQPFNETIASPLLTPGQYLWQQDYAIPNISSAPSANVVVGGTTVVSTYNTSTSAVVQATVLTESITNETWSTGITNWIPPSFGSGYQLKLYAGPSGASAATAAQYTNLPVGGTGANDSWFFDYQSGIINFGDTIVPAAVTGANVVYAFGSVYSGAIGVTSWANLTVAGNITSTNGNIVLTNGNIFLTNGNIVLTNGYYVGNISGASGSSTTSGNANVSAYATITPLSNNQTYYVEFANIATAGNSITGVYGGLSYNPGTNTLVAGSINAGTIGNVGASGAFGTITASTVNAATIGNTNAILTGANVTVTTGYIGTVNAGTVQAATIGNSGATLTGATLTTTSTIISSGNIVAGSGTATNDNNTGALIAKGGIAATGNINIGSQMFVGSGSQATVLTSALAVKRGTSSTGAGVQYTQDALINATSTGSSDFIAYANNYVGPNSDHGWMDMGFTGDAFSDPVYSITKANDGYLFASGANTTVGGNLVLATDWTGSYNDVVIGVGSFYANSEVARFHGNASNNGYLNLQYPTAATSTTTGALRVAGGVGIAGNLYASGIQNTPIGNTTASTGNFTTLNATTSITTATLNALTIGNTGAALTGATANVGSATINATLIANTVNAVTLGNTGANVNGTGTYLTALNPNNIAGTVATANAAIYTGITSTSSGTYYPLLSGQNNNGNVQAAFNSSLNYNAATGALTATSFSGTLAATNVSGTVATANVALYHNVLTASSSSTYFLTFANTTSGNSTINTVTTVNVNPATSTIFAASVNATSAALNSLILSGADNNGTQASSGALQITGGAGITGNLYVSGNVYAGNLISTTTQILEVNDPLVYLNASNPATYNYEIGLYSHFGPNANFPYQHTGLARDHNDYTWKFFSNVPEPSGGTVNLTNAIYDMIKAGNLILANSFNATSTTTGVLQVAGGAGIQGNLWAGNVNAQNIQSSGIFIGSGLGLTAVPGSSVTGTVATANAAVYTGITNTSSGTYYPLLSGQTTTGNVLSAVNASLNYNAANGTLNTPIVIATTVNAATIGNIGANLVGTGTYLTALSGGNITAGSIPNSALTNSSITVSQGTGITVTGSPVSLGGTVTITNAGVVSVNSTGAGNLTLTGTGSGPYTGSVTVALPTTGPGAVNVGSSTSVPTIVTDVYGRIVSLTSNAISTSFTASGTTGTTTVSGGSTLTFSSTNGVTIAVGGTYANISTPQDVRTTASPNFASTTLSGTLIAATVNAATIGNTGAVFSGASETLSGTLIAATVNAATIGNTGATVTGTNLNGVYVLASTGFSTANAVITGGSINGTTVGATTASTGNFTTLNAASGLTASSVSAATIGNASATLTGQTVNGVYVLASTGFSTANAVITGGSVNGTTIGATTASTGNFTTLNAASGLTASSVSAATIGNTSATLTGASITTTNGYIGTVNATTVQATTIGNTGAALTGASITTTNGYIGTVNATTVQATTIGNTGAAFTGSSATLTATLIATTVNAATIGNTGAALTGATANVGSATVNATLIANTVNAVTIGNTGANVNGTGTYLTALTAQNVNGTVNTANVAYYAATQPASSNSNYYLTFANATTGNSTINTTTAVNVNPSTGNVSATAFVATNFYGSGQYLTNISIGSLSGTYPTANVALFEQLTNSASNATYYIPFYDKATGNAAAYTNTTVNVNPSTGTISASAFSGAISSAMVTNALGYTPYNSTNPAGYVTSSGSVNSATYATQASTVAISASTTSSVYYPVFVPANTSTAQYEYVDGNNYLQYNPGTGNLATKIMTVLGNLTVSNASIFNTSQSSGQDHIVRGVKDSTLLWARPNNTYDTVIVGNSATASTVVNGAKLLINSTDSMVLPIGTSAQRPTASGLGTDTAGMFRYNSTGNYIEWYNGTNWANPTLGFTVISDQQFAGTGSQTAFTLSSSQTTASCIVSINGVVQIPTLAYSVSGVTLTFTEAPQSTDVIDVRMLTTTTTATYLSDTSGYNTANVSATGIQFTTGTTSANPTYNIDTSGAIVVVRPNITLATASVVANVDLFYANTYSSAEYTVTSVISGTNIRETSKILVNNNGTTAFYNEYGTLNTAGNTLVRWTATMYGNIVALQGNATNNSTIVRVGKTYLAL